AEADFSGTINSLRENFVVEINPDDTLVHKAFELRHQVYCVERGFLHGVDGVETDDFDSQAHHIVLLSRLNGEVMGTVRLVPGSPANADDSFPVQRVCRIPNSLQIPLHSTAEISRFAVSKQRRLASGAFMRLGLMQGIVQLSSMLGLSHWCAVMEPALLRML